MRDTLRKQPDRVTMLFPNDLTGGQDRAIGVSFLSNFRLSTRRREVNFFHFFFFLRKKSTTVLFFSELPALERAPSAF